MLRNETKVWFYVFINGLKEDKVICFTWTIDSGRTKNDIFAFERGIDVVLGFQFRHSVCRIRFIFVRSFGFGKMTFLSGTVSSKGRKIYEFCLLRVYRIDKVFRQIEIHLFKIV